MFHFFVYEEYIPQGQVDGGGAGRRRGKVVVILQQGYSVEEMGRGVLLSL